MGTSGLATTDVGHGGLDRPPATRVALAWAVGAAVTGLVVGVGAELLVGEASGGGRSGAASMAADTALATVVALVLVGIVAGRPSARTPVVTVAAVLAIVAVALAWYSPMALVIGATAFGLSGGRDRSTGGGRWASRAGTAGGVIAALWLLVFVGIVAAELLGG